MFIKFKAYGINITTGQDTKNLLMFVRVDTD